MSMQHKYKKSLSKRPPTYHAASMPFLTKNKSLEKTKKQPNKKVLKKCKSRYAFQIGKEVSKRTSSMTKTHKKFSSLRLLKKFGHRRQSLLIHSKDTYTLDNAYFPQHQPKSDKIQKSWLFLSSLPKYRVISRKNNSDSSRTLSRQFSKQDFNCPRMSFQDVLKRTHLLLNGYRERCSLLQRNNIRLKQQLLQAKKASYKLD